VPLAAPELPLWRGPAVTRAIDAWCVSVWDAFGESRQAVVDLLARHGIV